MEKIKFNKKNRGYKLWNDAKKYIPTGNSLLSKNPDLYLPNLWPTYYKKAKGCTITGVDGKNYIDMCMMGVGTNILGYSYKPIDNAVKNAVNNGNLSTLNCVEEIELAKKLIEINPWADMCKFARTGGEANSIAIRIARAFTKKDNIAICGYHGWHDWYLALNMKSKEKLQKILLKNLKTDGVPKSLKDTIYTFEYNDFKKVKHLVKKKKIGTIIMEVSKNYSPKNNFLKKIRDITKKNKIVLIFDECSSGFRETLGGLHKKFKVFPDICMYGKALGNGYAITAIVGKKKIMMSSKKTFISSTFWTERIGFVAGLKTISEMKRLKAYKIITKKGKYIKKKWALLAKKFNLDITISGIDALPNFNFNENHQILKTFITNEMLKKNILCTTNIFVSTAHSKKKIDLYLKNLSIVFDKISKCKNIKKIYQGKISDYKFDRLN